MESHLTTCRECILLYGRLIKGCPVFFDILIGWANDVARQAKEEDGFLSFDASVALGEVARSAT